MDYSRRRAAVGAVCSLAVAVQVECVALYLESVDVCDHFLDLLDAGITKLHDMVTIQADQMIMLPKAEGRVHIWPASFRTDGGLRGRNPKAD